MNLALDVLRTNGRVAREIEISAERLLTREDKRLLEEERGVQPEPLKRLTTRHHALARIIAEGSMNQTQAAISVGLSVSRVSILMDDPSFKELVIFYRELKDETYLDLHKRLANLSVEAADELLRRLEDEPNKVKTGELQEILKLTADRTGHGPQTSQNVNVNIGLADRLKAAQDRVKVIEGEAVVDNG